VTPLPWVAQRERHCPASLAGPVGTAIRGACQTTGQLRRISVPPAIRHRNEMTCGAALRRCRHHWANAAPPLSRSGTALGFSKRSGRRPFRGRAAAPLWWCTRRPRTASVRRASGNPERDCVEQCVPIREVQIDRWRGRPGALSDRANRNCFRVSGLDQQLSCGVNDRVAQLGAGSARARGGGELWQLPVTGRPPSAARLVDNQTLSLAQTSVSAMPVRP